MWLGSWTHRLSADLQKDLLSSDNKSWMWVPHPTAETALESLREAGGRGHTLAESWVDGCRARVPPSYRMESGIQVVSRPDASHHAPGADTLATTHRRVDPGVSPTGKQPQAVTRMARPLHQKGPVATRTGSRFLTDSFGKHVLLFVGNHFLKLFRMSEY